MTKEDKLILYKNEKWTFKGKSYSLKSMNIHNLNLTLNYLKKDPKGKSHNKPKSYWIEAINFMINYKNDENIKHLANKLLDIRYKKADIFVTKLCDSIKQMKFINQLKVNNG